MGQGITLKMTQKKNRRTKSKLEEAEPNAAQELHADDESNFPEGVGNAAGNDDVNVPAEIGREDDEQDKNQEKAAVDDEPKETGDLDSKDDNRDDDLSDDEEENFDMFGAFDDGNPIGSMMFPAPRMAPLPTSSNELENAPQTQADDEPKETGHLDPHDAEEIWKRKGKGIYHSDSDDEKWKDDKHDEYESKDGKPDDESKDDKPYDDEPKDDKPDVNLSDDEIFMDYKGDIYDKLGRPLNLIDGFDAGIPIATQKFPMPPMMKKKQPLPTSSNENPLYTEEEFEILIQRATRQSLIELENPGRSSHGGVEAGSSSSAMEDNLYHTEEEFERLIQQAKRQSLIENPEQSSQGGAKAAGSSSSAMEGNLFYTEEEFERQIQRAKHLSLLELQYPRPSSHPSSGSSSSVMEGPSSSDNPPVEYCPPQRQRQSDPSSSDDPPVEYFSALREREMPGIQSGLSSFEDLPQRKSILRWIRCAVCGVMKPPKRMIRVSCQCRQYAICVDNCIINLGAQLNTPLVCPDCSEDLFRVEFSELFAYVLCKLLLLKLDYLFRD